MSPEPHYIDYSAGRVTGRVELCLMNRWGTICRHGWNKVDAKVACKQLGYSTDEARGFRPGWEDGPGVFLSKRINCTGNENLLIDCDTSTNVSTCSRTQNAGVNCSINMLTST